MRTSIVASACTALLIFAGAAGALGQTQRDVQCLPKERLKTVTFVSGPHKKRFAFPKSAITGTRRSVQRDGDLVLQGNSWVSLTLPGWVKSKTNKTGPKLLVVLFPNDRLRLLGNRLAPHHPPGLNFWRFYTETRIRSLAAQHRAAHLFPLKSLITPTVRQAMRTTCLGCFMVLGDYYYLRSRGRFLNRTLLSCSVSDPRLFPRPCSLIAHVGDTIGTVAAYGRFDPAIEKFTWTRISEAGYVQLARRLDAFLLRARSCIH